MKKFIHCNFFDFFTSGLIFSLESWLDLKAVVQKNKPVINSSMKKNLTEIFSGGVHTGFWGSGCDCAHHHSCADPLPHPTVQAAPQGPQAQVGPDNSCQRVLNDL
jgi:hypothetical protein